MFPCTPSDIEEKTSPGRDILDEVLPTTMTYKDKNGNSVDFRDKVYEEIRALYWNRRICYYNVDKWVRRVSTEFSPEVVRNLGKGYALYELDRELDVDYLNQESTTTTEVEELPDVPIGNDQYLSQRGSTHTTLKQPSGPMGSAAAVRDSIFSIHNVLIEFAKGLEKYFLPGDLVDLALFGRW